MSVYFYGCVSLDGYLADQNHGLEWLDQTGSAEDAGYEDFYRHMDVTIMGKRTFQAIEHLEDIENVYPTTENYVFTHAKTLPCRGFIPVSGNVADFVERIDREKNIWIIGGNTILAPLLERDMVDRIIVQVAPVLLGKGVPLFTQEEKQRRFRLDGVKQFGQFAELRYSKL